ncbi:SDR family NAD(P)-dependent oxidoreductase [Halomonas urumqiensis]|uniref:3-hydroxyacyl-CoA dehydrogenase n=1 Tax=Halomonas urumqiensis TaxID=1684789 RepID=A0A2N7UMF0_9GAMM|nr:SDR family NAD(P)-dependent oxidoreductase [Halomonas urumqiensis]PMR81630.1 3-hydroxyacyl-CoA dehydrogenase [Halomonas urumqiensis]PTB02267.1 KR domain-containing protein [Halomonas urumqiensis]GHE21735.1 3-hydroxyacyl-CoA dehydrogenase [Halomonas urumqiensis]
MQLNGSVAIVTGGVSGLGEATVRRFVAQGGRVMVFDLNEARGQALIEELGGNVAYRQVDVTDEAMVKRAVDDTVATFGALHICCNFAGIASAAKTVGKEGAFPLGDFRKVIDINLIGTFNVLRLAALAMAANKPLDEHGGRGVIINTASIAAYEGQVGQAAYSASKAGIVGMTLPIARDLASLGIRVNTIVPGLIHTPLFDALPESAISSLSASVLNPQRLGQPGEVAHLAQYIVENDYTNGECIRIDGGIRMQPR